MHADASWSRIARQSGSTIRFASFDPSTASGDITNASAFKKLTLNEELCRPKRVVIETTPDGSSTWRFVPNARREVGVETESVWPRVVDVCGELRTLTQDQWDVYKLNRDFDCLVRLPPHHTTIIRCAGAHIDSPFKAATVEDLPLEDQAIRYKRRLSDSVFARRLSGSNHEGRRKKARPRDDGSFSSSSSEDDGENEAEEEEVSGMVVDEEVPPKRHQLSERLKKVRANKEEARRKRWEWNAQMRQKMGLAVPEEEKDENMMSWTEIPNPSPVRLQTTSSPFVKRKVDSFSDDGEVYDDDSDPSTPSFKTYAKSGPSKRTRTVSPVVTRRAAEIRRNRRGNSRKEELERRAKARAQAIHENVMKELYEEAARSQPTQSQTNGTDDTRTDPSSFSSQSSSQPSQEVPIDEGARRRAALEESKRKIAELEKDKHLWEEQARRRAAQEAEERARVEAARQAHVTSETATAGREKERVNASRRAEENERHSKEDVAADVRAKRKHAREAAQRDARAWIVKGWTARRALERYMARADAFDAMNFFKGDVIVFETVSWPVLMRPGTFSVEDIDWTAVETFFRQVRAYLPTTEYRKLVERSHKRFHPDRWRSRRVLQCVEDEEEKECLEVAANTVAQALTPLWQEVTGR